MPGVQHLLRKAAIEKMASPEQLDMAMRVTSPVSWLALVTIAAMITAGIFWSIYGTIYVRVDGTGLWMQGGGVKTVQANDNGRVKEITVEEGDYVEEGQVVAVLELEDLSRQVDQAEQQLASEQSALASARIDANVTVSQHELDIADLESQIQRMEQLYEKNRSVRRQDIDRLQAQKRGKENQITQARSRLQPLRSRVEQARIRLEKIREQLGSNAQVTSPHAGTVVAINSQEGEFIQRGASVVDLSDEAGEEQVYLYVPLAEGKKIKPGMTVQVSPQQFKREEWGYIIGTVESVSAQPVTMAQLKTTHENPALEQKFARDTPFRVITTPGRDEENVSGWEWSSGRGPAEEVGANSPVNAQVVIDTKRPIELVIPMLKNMTGMS
jgi:HlyD family secretion protein